MPSTPPPREALEPTTTRRPPPREAWKPPRIFRVLCDWDSTTSGNGNGYVSLCYGDLVECVQPPEEPEGWGYGAVWNQQLAGCLENVTKQAASCGGAGVRIGWFPPAFVAELDLEYF